MCLEPIPINISIIDLGDKTECPLRELADNGGGVADG